MFGNFGRTQYDVNFSLFRIPIQIHPFFWIIAIWLSPFFSSTGNREGRVWLAGLLGWIAAFLASFLVHELGHALVIKRIFGANPWIGLYGFCGLTFHQPYYRRTPGPWGRVLISFAGPAAGFLASGLLIVFCLLLGGQLAFSSYPLGPIVLPIVFPAAVFDWIQSTTPIFSLFGWFVYGFVLTTFVWGILNLLPIQPLDGGAMSQEIFVYFDKRNGLITSLWVSVLCAGALALISLQERLYLTAVFCGFFAYQNFQKIQFYQNGRFR